jgi:hypothetical protein
LAGAGLMQEDTAGLNCVLEDELYRKCCKMIIDGKAEQPPQSDAAELLYAGSQD